MDETETPLPRGARRWWPDVLPRLPARVKQEFCKSYPRKPARNTVSMWQMNFPQELPDGSRNPICALGECGDPMCPTFRPKHPEVREAVEKSILEKCQGHFSPGQLKTYASVGCGLLGQDWIVLEQLRQQGMLPCRAIFVELRTAKPVMTCEGAEFPRTTSDGGINLRQTGFNGDLGPDFAFSATLQFGKPVDTSFIFDFCDDGRQDAIFVEVGGPEKIGYLGFGCVGDQRHCLPVEDCWQPEDQAHTFLFTISAVGMYNVYKDGQLLARSYGPTPRCCPRRHLYVGRSAVSCVTKHCFRGRIQKIKVWDQEVDTLATDMMYSHEVANAHQTIAQWYMDEMAVWSFSSLAAYAAACAKDRTFAADLLLKVDVHEELDGYDDFVCKALGPNGLALTLGGPGKSWRRSGTGWIPVDTKCAILDSAEERMLVPWAFMGAFPGHQDRQHFFAKAFQNQRADCSESRRRPRQRRPRKFRTAPRRGRARSRRTRSAETMCTEGRWYSMTDEDVQVRTNEASVLELLDELCTEPAEREALAEEVELERSDVLSDLDQIAEELPGLVIYGRS
mmetsp:Transcript_11555/g.21891  ORF Transcript_11555/g.21891 Transcript_11555/m.21891 type:complete len:564 (+) Transcript_11555:23-1714(+)